MSWQLKVGDKVKFVEEKQVYTVQAGNGVYTVLTKPFNARKTVLYTIISWLENVRGPENLVFGMGAETKKQCEEMLERLIAGETEVSGRHRIKLNIESIKPTQPSREEVK